MTPQSKRNQYGSLCTEMYEILHASAPQDELDFYLSYAEKGMRILEPMCGSGRFLVPFYQRGFAITGLDASAEMLEKLRRKAPGAAVVQADMARYDFQEKYDYVFIPSGSICLFTDMETCGKILEKIRRLLTPGGKLALCVDTVADRLPDDGCYKETASVQTPDGLRLKLIAQNTYDPASRTQFSPGVYQLFDGKTLLRREEMDFQTHLYAPGEMEGCLRRAGFRQITAYASCRGDAADPAGPDARVFVCTA